MTSQQEFLLDSLIKVDGAHSVIIDILGLLEDTIGEESPLYQKLDHANDLMNDATELIYEFFGKETFNPSEEAKENFFRWINGEKMTTEE